MPNEEPKQNKNLKIPKSDVTRQRMNKEQNRMIKKEGKSLEKKTNKPKTNKQKKILTRVYCFLYMKSIINLFTLLH